jgi:hypothetical protein
MMVDSVAPPPATVARIRRIELSDFRAFPAVQPGVFDLGQHGGNLLVFGENGAGKSSIYRGLRGLFSVNPPEIIGLHNVFTEPAQPSVRLTMTDNSVLAWTAAGHPTIEVRDAARRAAFLSHTRLMEMNRGATADVPPNLFEVAVNRLLADYEATLDGGVRRSLGELWQELETAFAARVTTAKGVRRPQNYIRDVVAACERFNEAMRQALDALEAHAKPLLRRLLDVLAGDGLELVGLTFPRVRYDEEKRTLENQILTPVVKFRTHLPPAPQNFLNEARLSALAIAIYLAARLTCVPPKGAGGLKLLVMDDLLISLDSSHRRPVLDAIAELFEDWQIILLTHDRYWFELAREQLAKDRWSVVEVYERLDGDGLLVPLVRPVSDNAVEETIKQASMFLKDNHPAAAANYARSACELALRRFCVKRSVPFPYFEDTSRPDLNELLTTAKKYFIGDPARHGALVALEPHKRYVLNPLSHDPLKPIPAADVAAAIDAVKEIVKASGKTYP